MSVRVQVPPRVLVVGEVEKARPDKSGWPEMVVWVQVPPSIVVEINFYRYVLCIYFEVSQERSLLHRLFGIS
jgi:hypothetical protein